MKSISRRVFCAAAVCALYGMSGSLQAASGLLIVEKTSSGGEPTINQIQIESNRMRAESTGMRGEKQVMIFDGTRQVLIMIDNDKKTYTEMTKADADELGAQLTGMMAQIEKQLAGLPPEQRAQVEAMMKGRMGGAGGAGAPKVQYRKTGTDRVGKWTCDKYEGYEAEKKVADVCTVDPKVLGYSEADFAVSRQMMDFFKKLAPQQAAQMFGIGNMAEQGFAGIPVRRTFTVLGRQITSEISEVSRQTFPDSAYAPPAGYQKVAFGAGRGRGR
jgi:hypothetical protein